MWFSIALSLVIVAYNNVANRWGPFHRAAYVPLNVAFVITFTGLAAIVMELTAVELGLHQDLGDVVFPLTLVAFFALGAFVIALSPRGRSIADERVAGMRGGDLAFYVLVRIPIGTALVEEVLFRGVLFAAWREAGASTLAAAICASTAFGLWHIQPAVEGLRMNDPAASTRKVSVVVTGAVVATTVAGLGLTWLRVWSGGLVGPILLHAGVNSLGALAAVVAHRRMELDDVRPTNRRSL